MKQHPLTLTALALLILAGCGKGNDTPQLPGVTDRNATLIAFNTDDEMIDFVHVAPEDHIDRVEFLAPDNGDPVTVVGIGPALHPDFPANRAVSSKQAEGFQGKVTAEVEDGDIQQLMGNSIHFGSPLTLEHLKQIHDKLEAGDHTHAESTRIVRVDPAILELTTDADGNRTPPDLTPEQTKFLDTVIAAVEAEDLETLRGFGHRDPDDTSSHDSHARHFEGILEKDLHHYRFMRFTADHPNNRDKLELHDGRPLRYSLDPEWILTLYHTPEDATMVYSSDLIVGNENGKLKFPKKYAEAE